MNQQFMVRRTADRVDMRVTALLVGRHGKVGVETAVTENLSARGARVVSTSEWQPDETILIALPGFHFTSAARVAYSDSLGDGRFRMGLEFVVASQDLEVAAVATALEFPQARSRPGSSARSFSLPTIRQ
jgi:hypothetical protein